MIIDSRATPSKSPASLKHHGDRGVMQCPVCGNCRVRPVAVCCMPDGRLTTDVEGLYIEAGDGGRGLDVGIAFTGSCGHWFALGFETREDGTLVELSCSAREEKAQRCAR